MFYKAALPYVQAFFNYLSIVEICIDKGLSGGDLCSCQLSQRKAPSDTKWIDRHALHNREAFSGASMWVREHVGAGAVRAGGEAKDFFINRARLAFDLRGTGWAGGRSAGLLKPLWVPGSRCEAWHWLWHTQGLEWHWPGCKHNKYTQKSQTYTRTESALLRSVCV